jgi:glyoxylase-like metal-dependent hydrolase (beta-lactamase superfamily II)
MARPGRQPHGRHDRPGRPHPHASIRLAVDGSPIGRVHRLDRRRFLAEIGRRSFAVAILGGVAACSDNRDAAVPPDSLPADRTNEPAPGSTDGPSTRVGDAEVLRWAQVPLGFVSAYVLVRGNTAAVVDTGTSGSADAIGATLATLGVTFDDVAHVVLTHRHPDHVGSLEAVLERSAGSVAAYAGAADIPEIASPLVLTAVGDGDDVFGLQVIETPGHTLGSISVLDTGIGLLVAGDALNGNDDGTAITGPNPDFTDDVAIATASVDKLAGFEFEAAAFGHGQPVTAGAGAMVRALLDA